MIEVHRNKNSRRQTVCMIEVHRNKNSASRPCGPCVTPWWWGKSCRAVTESLTSNSVWFSGSRPRPDRSWSRPVRQPSRRDHCGGSDPPRRGLAVNCKVKRLPPPGAAPAVKKGGSLPPPAPLSCVAPSRRARWGHARGSLAALCRMGCRKSVPPLGPCGVSEKPRTTTGRPPPSEREALWLSKT